MEWCQDSLALGFKREFFLVKFDSGDLKELFPTGKMMEPTITRLDNNRLALGRDNMTIFIDAEGDPTQTYAPTWTDMPISMGTLLHGNFLKISMYISRFVCVCVCF